MPGEEADAKAAVLAPPPMSRNASSASMSEAEGASEGGHRSAWLTGVLLTYSPFPYFDDARLCMRPGGPTPRRAPSGQARGTPTLACLGPRRALLQRRPHRHWLRSSPPQPSRRSRQPTTSRSSSPPYSCVLGVLWHVACQLTSHLSCGVQASLFMPANTGDGAAQGPRFFVPGAAAASQVTPACYGHDLPLQM
jgi:hypothetical protein